MKKILLVVLILIDVLIMVSAAFFLYIHLTSPSRSGMGMLNALSPVIPMNPRAASPGNLHSNSLIVASTSTPGVVTAPEPPLEGGMRKILFSYRNPKARQVAIRADFTGWKAEPMHKDARSMWIYQANLLPGEYAYCFTVDEKTFRDPANKRTKQIGRTYVSAIVVKPASPTPH